MMDVALQQTAQCGGWAENKQTSEASSYWSVGITLIWVLLGRIRILADQSLQDVTAEFGTMKKDNYRSFAYSKSLQENILNNQAKRRNNAPAF